MFKNMKPSTKFVLAETLRVAVCATAIVAARRVIVKGAFVLVGATR